MKSFLALLSASFKEFVRDRMAMFWTLAFPIMFILIFGVFFADEDSGAYSVGLVLEDESDPMALGFFCYLELIDRDDDQASPLSPDDAQLCTPWLEQNQATLSSSAAGPIESESAQLPLHVNRGTLDEELDKLNNGDRRAVIVFPAGFQERVGEGLRGGSVMANVQVHFDASQRTTAQIVQSIIASLLDNYDRQLSGSAPLIQVDFQSTTADRFRFIDFFVPGMVAVSLMQLGLFGALTVVSLRERKILKRLGATPLPRRTLVLSQVTLRMGIAIVQTSVILVVGRVAFNVEIGNQIPLMAALILLGSLTFTAMGYLVASFARTEAAGNAIVQALQFPMMFLSGVYWPIEFAPDWMQPVIKAMPLTYLGDAMRQAMVEGSSQLFPLALDVGVLVGWLVVSLFLSFRFFRWE